MAPKKITDAEKAAEEPPPHRVARRGDISNNVIAPFRSRLAAAAEPVDACRVARRRARAFRRVRAAALIFSFWNLQY